MIPPSLIGLHPFTPVKDQTHWAFRTKMHSFSSMVRSNFRLINLASYLFHTSFPQLPQLCATTGLPFWFHRSYDAFFSFHDTLTPLSFPFPQKINVYQILFEIRSLHLSFILCSSICKTLYICDTEGADVAHFQNRPWSVLRTQLCK